MRHDSNWPEYLRKLAKEEADPSPRRSQHSIDSRSGTATRHTSSHRDEWLQAGYSAQMSLPFRSGR
jgi:hypothetical protein